MLSVMDIKNINSLSEEVQLAAVGKFTPSVSGIKNPSEKVQLAALENVWSKHFYENFIKDLPNKTEWFYREFNRLKLIKGLLK